MYWPTFSLISQIKNSFSRLTRLKANSKILILAHHQPLLIVQSCLPVFKDFFCFTENTSANNFASDNTLGHFATNIQNMKTTLESEILVAIR